MEDLRLYLSPLLLSGSYHSLLPSSLQDGKYILSQPAHSYDQPYYIHTSLSAHVNAEIKCSKNECVQKGVTKYF
jgi:hypothetical protein